MIDKEKLKQGLEQIRRQAEGNHGHTTVSQIVAAFPGSQLDEETVRLVHKYLDEEKILIEDYKLHDTRQIAVQPELFSGRQETGSPEDVSSEEAGSGAIPDVEEIAAELARDEEEVREEEALEGEELAYFQMYLDDLESIDPCTDEEMRILSGHLRAGDENAQNRLIEGNLFLVLEEARHAANQGVLLGDLVQEGNMALVDAIEEYRRSGVRQENDTFSAYLRKKIAGSMQQLLREQSGYDTALNTMAAESNRLLETVRSFEEEYGRAATLAELSERMNLSADRVEELLRISWRSMQKDQ